MAVSALTTGLVRQINRPRAAIDRSENAENVVPESADRVRGVVVPGHRPGGAQGRGSLRA